MCALRTQEHAIDEVRTQYSTRMPLKERGVELKRKSKSHIMTSQRNDSPSESIVLGPHVPERTWTICTPSLNLGP